MTNRILFCGSSNCYVGDVTSKVCRNTCQGKGHLNWHRACRGTNNVSVEVDTGLNLKISWYTSTAWRMNTLSPLHSWPASHPATHGDWVSQPDLIHLVTLPPSAKYPPTLEKHDPGDTRYKELPSEGPLWPDCPNQVSSTQRLNHSCAYINTKHK